MSLVALEELKLLTEDLTEDFNLEKLGVFGSVARGEQTSESDLDIYAVFANPTPETMYDRYFGLIEKLKKTFHCDVQVVTPSMIRNPVFKKSLHQDLVLLHG